MREDSSELNIARRFLWLGVAALAFAGIFAIILVTARTPQLKDFTLFQQLFSVALVVHVDLSVLLWFLCVGAMGWSLLIARMQRPWPYWQAAGLALITGATLLIAFSPLARPWEVIKSNYIPVLDNPLFLLGLTLLASGLCVVLVQLLVAYGHHRQRRLLSYVDLGWLYAGFTTALALVAFFLSADMLPQDLPRDAQLETLFWAGGHILQFSYSALMMAAWLLLLQQITGREQKTFWIFIAYTLLAGSAILSFAGFAMFPFDSEDFRVHQSEVMIRFLGLGPLLLSVIIAGGWLRFASAEKALWRTDSRAFGSALLMSLLLFFAGSFLGLMIRGQNVTIPAHYHGAIVGVTLALMGVAYAMLPRFGYGAVAQWRLAFWQPIVYGIGQLMHIGGLAYSGGYGVLRKTPDAATEIAPNIKIAMGIMGLGGSLAILGGLLFVLVMLRALLQARRLAED
jgi:cytochrome c oxidase subunit 1